MAGPLPVEGNTIQVLQNGDEFFPAMLKAIRDAKKTINFEAYIVYSDEIGRAFCGALGERARAGLEVRLWERPGPLSWGTVLARWFAQNVSGLLQAVPVVNLVTWVYPLLDCLWPLWDGRRQSLHDKLARTCVVRRR